LAIKLLAISNYDRPGIHDTRPEAEMFIGLKAHGIDLEFMTKGDCYYAERMRSLGIPVHDFVPRKKFSLEAVRRIRHHLETGNHDIVHLLNNKAIVNGIFASTGLPVKIVTYRGQTGNISRFDPSCYLTHLNPRVDRIVCVSNSVRVSLQVQLRTPGKAITIYKGHELSWYADTQPADLEKFGIPRGAFVVGCIANNRPRKGVTVLIESANHLPPDSGIHFILVGRGMTHESIQEMVTDSRFRSNFHLFDHRQDVLEIVAACDATVLPAIKREGLPKTVIESMALGTTPIVTNTGGGPELVINGESGLVVPPSDPAALADAICRLYSNRTETDRLAGEARQRIATSFRLEDSVRAHLALYQELVPDR